MSTEPTGRPLDEIACGIPDPRHRRGTASSVASVLTLIAVAMLPGARRLAAIAPWGHDHNAVLWLMQASGSTGIAAALRRHAAKPLEALGWVMNPVPPDPQDL